MNVRGQLNIHEIGCPRTASNVATQQGRDVTAMQHNDLARSLPTDSGFGLSGFQRSGVYDLTATKAAYWHGNQPGCKCADLHNPLSAIFEKHLGPAGFTQEEAPSQYVLRLRGPGIQERRTGPMYEAISGRRSRKR